MLCYKSAESHLLELAVAVSYSLLEMASTLRSDIIEIDHEIEEPITSQYK